MYNLLMKTINLEPGGSVLVRAHRVDFQGMDVKGYFGGDLRLVVPSSPEEVAALKHYEALVSRNVSAIAGGFRGNQLDKDELDASYDDLTVANVSLELLNSRHAVEAGARILNEAGLKPMSEARRASEYFFGRVAEAALNKPLR